MRPLSLLLVLVAPLAAQEQLEPSLEKFREAYAAFEAGGARPAVEGALKVLEASGDPRVLDSIADALVGSIGMELRLLESGRKLQRKGADAQDRILGVRGELELLEKRKLAGATDVDPEIAKRVEEMRRLDSVYQRSLADRETYRLLAIDAAAVRDLLADTYGRMLAAAGETDAGRAGIATLRKHVDLANPDHALYFVRVVRASGLRAGVPALVEVLDDEKTSEALARNVISALGRIGARSGIDAVIRIWERSPEQFEAPARHALSLAARRNLADLEQARAWAKTVEG